MAALPPLLIAPRPNGGYFMDDPLVFFGYNTVFYRGYTGKKFDDNIQCEIFQTALEEAQEAYRAEIVHELQSNTDDDMSANLSTINNWIQKWKQEHPTH
ncbi:Adenylate kinase isoenzyme 6 [Homalodisca vitripennis]|nr:Adenylate kinase isoenzyme 6 [Homalodisca vitripennis]